VAGFQHKKKKKKKKNPKDKKKARLWLRSGLQTICSFFSGMRRNAENSHFDEAPLAGNYGECLKLSYLITLLLGGWEE
jgi:hypothetical protein